MRNFLFFLLMILMYILIKDIKLSIFIVFVFSIMNEIVDDFYFDIVIFRVGFLSIVVIVILLSSFIFFVLFGFYFGIMMLFYSYLFRYSVNYLSL